ncbi:unnamed protein product [Vicia faba]|uniref:Carbohydrate kinase PfkB domain-containing protein n=1 Tax=Vicia faba TaxID=3906 RepID=A0AAV1A7A6_VICFA|nr:unnamed protein product [Vicia faba]
MPLLPLPSTTKTLNSPSPFHLHNHHHVSSFQSKSKPKFQFHPILSLNLACKGLTLVVSSSSLSETKLRSVGSKNIDDATMGNLCLDIVLNVPQLPPLSIHERKAFMERLASSPPPKKYWEADGNCNMAIAAARLRLDCVSIGHVGDEIYGNFLSDVHRDEGISMVKISTGDDTVTSSGDSYETLVCWVLVDPLQKHDFCSRADFCKEPAFNWLSQISKEAKLAIKNSKVLFCNVYGFDDLSPSLLLSVVDCAVEVGTSIFFDPGPRGKSLSNGTPEEQRALNQFLRMSDVLLLTADEAESLTGIGDPILAGQKLLKVGILTKNVASLEKVVDILRSPKLNEDDEFWTEILEKKVLDREVTCLSNIMKGNRNHLNFVSFDQVASELLPKLEFPQTVENVPT